MGIQRAIYIGVNARIRSQSPEFEPGTTGLEAAKTKNPGARGPELKEEDTQ